MTFDNARIKDLIIKHLKSELTPTEHEVLMHWAQSSPDNATILQELESPQQLSADLRTWMESNKNVQAKIFAQCPELREPSHTNNLTVFHIRKKTWFYAAASIIGTLIAVYLLFRTSHHPSTIIASTPSIDIAPGTNKATLTLADNSVINLDQAGDGSLGHQANTNIIKKADHLSYEPTHRTQSIAASPSYNTLTTPKAGQYQLTLPDGSKVWLNNVSSLRYPTSFTGSQREVFLTGEAYFEIADNPSKPFKVHLNHSTIQVLGTSFNIAAYTDEPVIKTTLVTGKISVATPDGQPTLLQPGQQAILTQTGTIEKIKETDIDAAISWTKGYFRFDHANISEVLRQLTRWYDIEVTFSIPIPDYQYDGDIGRDLSLTAILKHLEKKDVHFIIEGKTLIVTR
jgi:ferric-dicitrate binding protein FerR (iron transport regulator)